MRKLPSTVSSAETFSQMDKERTLFFHENCILVCVLKLFLDNYPFKYTWEFSHEFFWEERYRLLLCSDKWRYKHLLTLNFSLQYAKRQSKQHPCEHLLHESLVGQREYTTQTKSSFKGIVLCLSLSFRYLVELELFQSLKMKLSGLKYG